VQRAAALNGCHTCASACRGWPLRPGFTEQEYPSTMPTTLLAQERGNGVCGPPCGGWELVCGLDPTVMRTAVERRLQILGKRGAIRWWRTPRMRHRPADRRLAKCMQLHLLRVLRLSGVEGTRRQISGWHGCFVDGSRQLRAWGSSPASLVKGARVDQRGCDRSARHSFNPKAVRP